MEIIFREKGRRVRSDTFIPEDSFSDIIQPTEQTEMGQALENLNRDDFDPITRMSDADQRAHLFQLEFTGIWQAESLVVGKFLPPMITQITRSFKRMSPSRGGTGREQIVKIARGMREDNIESGKSLWQKINPFAGDKK